MVNACHVFADCITKCVIEHRILTNYTQKQIWLYKVKKVFVICYFLTNVLVWLFARPSLHIGASGIVYGIAFFLIFYGFFKKDFKSLLISLIIIFFYGGLVYGLFPNQPGISWESHLIGAIVGGYTAMNFAQIKSKRIFWFSVQSIFRKRLPESKQIIAWKVNFAV